MLERSQLELEMGLRRTIYTEGEDPDEKGYSSWAGAEIAVGLEEWKLRQAPRTKEVKEHDHEVKSFVRMFRQVSLLGGRKLQDRPKWSKHEDRVYVLLQDVVMCCLVLSSVCHCLWNCALSLF